MSCQRYTPEFKDESVRQVVDRGHSVAEVTDRLGVSSHSLYNFPLRQDSCPLNRYTAKGARS